MEEELAASSSILRELINSNKTGNLVAIWAKKLNNGVCLTAVEDIQPVEITNDKLIVLKKFDLHYGQPENPKIPLSEIEKVISFNTPYDEYLLASISEDYINKSFIKIRKDEQAITRSDLENIFIRNINSGRKIKIKQTHQPESGYYYVMEYLPHKEQVVLSYNLHYNQQLEEVHLSNIKEIEFEFYFHYNGISSINFKVNHT